MVSRKLREAVKMSLMRAYQIAYAAGLHPVVLSKLLNGIERARPNDPRVLAVAKVLGLSPKACFEEG
jgi:hypothetical protein